jgi:hypothetical protein
MSCRSPAVRFSKSGRRSIRGVRLVGSRQAPR